ncbi:drug/metabolite transporter permease [Klebsiella pneumoniae]|nr:drug/metabolite transporter permease [Klebsiella pneumoniae]
MHVRYSLLASQATTALFVLLWGSAAIFTRWGLDNASPMALLVFRFLVALVALAPLAIVRRRWLPAPGTRLQTAATGLMLIGGYSVCYFEAMANGVTPGLIATIMGIQPILTLCVVERRLQGRRLSGLLLALAGLVLLVWRSLAASPMATAGSCWCSAQRRSAPADGEPGAAASGSFSCHLFYACSRQLILTSKGKYHGQHADDF